MGANPQYGAGPWWFPTQGRVTARREEAEETGGWESVITTIGGGNVGIRLRGDREIHKKEEEHGRTVYCDATNSGPL